MKQWLESNKVYFETLAAVLLSIMAILLSIYQGCLTSKQTQLLEKQIQIAEKEFEFLKIKEKTLKTAQWGKLRNTVWSIFDMYPQQGKAYFKFSNNRDYSFWVSKMWDLLNSEIDNPVLISDSESLRLWRRSISRLHLYKKLGLYAENEPNPGQINDVFVGEMYLINNDIFYVYQKLVVASDEPQATLSIFTSVEQESEIKQNVKEKIKGDGLDGGESL